MGVGEVINKRGRDGSMLMSSTTLILSVRDGILYLYGVRGGIYSLAQRNCHDLKVNLGMECFLFPSNREMADNCWTVEKAPRDSSFAGRISVAKRRIGRNEKNQHSETQLSPMLRLRKDWLEQRMRLYFRSQEKPFVAE